MVLYQSTLTQSEAHRPFELTETLSQSTDTHPSPVCALVLPCTFFCFNSSDEWQLVVKYQCCPTDLLLFLEAGLGEMFSSCFSADSFLKPSSLNQPAQQPNTPVLYQRAALNLRGTKGGWKKAGGKKAIPNPQFQPSSSSASANYLYFSSSIRLFENSKTGSS